MIISRHMNLDDLSERISNQEPVSRKDAEDLALPSGLTPESAYYAQDGPREQVIADLRSIISQCETHGTLEATELAQEAQEALDEMEA